MKIAIESQFLNHSRRSGLMTYTEGLIKSLIANDPVNQYSLLYYSLKRKAKDMPGPESKNFLKDVLCFPDLEFPHYEFLRSRLVLSPYLLKNKVTVYHKPAGYEMPQIKNVFKILTVHDLRTLTIKDQSFKINENSYKETINRSDLIAVVSECTKNDLIRLFDIKEKKIVVTYLGADERYRPASHQNIEITLNKFGIKKPYLLAIGSVPRKNLKNVIKAFAESKASKNFYLVCCCPYPKMYQPLANSLGVQDKVKFLTNIMDEELVHLYSGSYCFVFPSLYEGFGLPILEAMNCHCPVITSTTSACPEVAGNAALKVQPENVDEIAQAINTITSNGNFRNDLILKGIQQTKLFSWNNFAKKMLSIYKMAG